MKPEIRAVLENIGYTRARLYNPSLVFSAWEPTQRGDRLYKGKQEANVCKKALGSLLQALETCPLHVQQIVSSHSKISTDWDEARDPFSEVIQAISELITMTDREFAEFWDSGGAPPRPAGEDIAKKMAEIYVLGMGKLPTVGANSDGDPTGRFSRAVAETFLLLGMPDNFRRPCRVAVDELKRDDNLRFEQLMRLRQNGERKWPWLG